MANKSVEILQSNNNPEIQERINNLGEFKKILKEQFTSKRNKDLDDFLDGDLNSVDKQRLDYFMSNTEPQLLELKKQSEKQNLSIKEIKKLLSSQNSGLIPESIKKQLHTQLEIELSTELKEIDSEFLDISKLKTYLKQDNTIIDKVSFLESYLSFFSEINTTELGYLKEYLKNPQTENINFLSLSTVEYISKLTTIGNYAPGIIPTATLASFNTLTFNYTQSGVLNPLAMEAFIQNEEGIRGIGRKTIELREVENRTGNSTTESSNILETIEQIETLIGVERLDTFMSNTNHKKIISQIKLKQIDQINLDDFRQMESQFTFMIKQIQNENGYIPYSYLIMQSQLEGIGQHLFFESENNDTEHAKKMLQFLDMCEDWMKYDEGFDDEEFSEIKNLKNKIIKGEIKSFSDLEPSRFSLDKGETDTLQKYWNYLKDEVLDDTGIHDDSIRRLEKRLGVKDDWDIDIVDISMSDLDEKLKLINNRNGNTLENLKLAQATDMVSWNASGKEQTFAFIESEVVEQLVSKEITTHEALEPNNDLVEAKAKELNEQINSNVFLSEISKLSDPKKQQIVNSALGKNTPLSGADLDEAVLDAIKETALKQTAYRTLFQKNILEMTQDGSNLSGMQKIYMQKHNSLFNDIASGTVEIAETLVKEAIIFAITSVLTAGVGGWATTSARIGGALYTNKIGRGVNSVLKLTNPELVGFTNKAARFGVNGTKFVGARAFEAGLYTAGASMMYENQEFTIDSYTTNLALFAGGITGMKIGDKLIPRNSGEFTKKLSQMLGGSIGGTGALIMTEGQGDITFEESMGMMAQGVLMGGLMFPLMRHQGLQKTGKGWGEKFANRDSVKANRDFNNIQSQLKIDNQLRRNSLNISDSLKKVGRANIDTKTKVLQNTRKAELEIDLRNQNGQRSSIAKGLGNVKTSIKTGLENTKLKTVNSIKNTPDNARLSINKFLAENRSARLESLKKIDHRAKYSDIGNGFTLKNGKEIVNRDFDTIATLPDGIKIDSIQYLKFGNKRIPTLQLSDGKTLRLSTDINKGNNKTFEKLLSELSSNPGSIEGIYNQKGNIAGYKVTLDNGTVKYFNQNRLNPSKDTGKKSHFDNDSLYTRKTLASNGKFTPDEMIDAGLSVKGKQEYRNNYDKAFKESFPDGFNPQKTLMDRLKSIQKNPNATPAQKKEAGKIMTLLGKAGKGVGFIWSTSKKTLMYSAMIGGGALGIDYLPDQEIDMFDVNGLGMAIGTLALTSDAGITLLGKLGGENGEKVAKSLKQAKGNNKMISKVLQLGSAIVAYDLASGNN